jgi:hypothetical protein
VVKALDFGSITIRFKVLISMGAKCKQFLGASHWLIYIYAKIKLHKFSCLPCQSGRNS